MLLHYALEGAGSVHGLPFEDHLLAVPEDQLALIPDILSNPFWRLATDEEITDHAVKAQPDASTRTNDAAPKRTGKRKATA